MFMHLERPVDVKNSGVMSAHVVRPRKHAENVQCESRGCYGRDTGCIPSSFFATKEWYVIKLFAHKCEPIFDDDGNVASAEFHSVLVRPEVDGFESRGVHEILDRTKYGSGEGRAREVENGAHSGSSIDVWARGHGHHLLE